jgi:hypothetical protein
VSGYSGYSGYSGAGTTIGGTNTQVQYNNSGALGGVPLLTYNGTTLAMTGSTIDGTVIGGTTPAALTATTITGQTEVLKGTGDNLLTYSNTFTNGAWANSAETLTTGQSDPFGGTSATLIVPTSANTTHQLYQGPSAYTGQYTVSIYVKASGYSLFWISDTGAGIFACGYDLSAVTATPNTGCTGTITAVSGAAGWYRLTCTITGTTTSGSRFTVTPYPTGTTLNRFNLTFAGDGTSGAVIYGAQWEIGNIANTYIATTTTAIYGTPTLSFSGVAGLGLQSDGSLYVSPAGTGALQAQKTDSTATGGNARGANAVDWQTSRGGAGQVSSGSYSNILGGISNTSVSYASTVVGGTTNYGSGTASFLGGGGSNTTSGNYSVLVGGGANTTSGYYNFVGGGFTNSGTSGSAVTTQSSTMNGTTAVTLSGSNASIKVGQYITGTSIAGDTYVAAISGTSLTLSKNASGSSTSTLSFYTPHGVVVGGGNNQATGSYSFIGGGGDAGTSSQRNGASGDWSVVCGGINNIASGLGSFIGGGGTDGTTAYGNRASGTYSVISGGVSNYATGFGSAIIGMNGNTASGAYSSVIGGNYTTTRSITGMTSNASSYTPFGTYTAGQSQSSILVLGRQTTDATPKTLTSDTSATGSTTNQVIMPDNSAYYFKAKVIAGVTGAGNTKAWTLEGAIKRGSGVGTTAIVGTVTTTVVAADAGAATWTVTATADTTNGGLAITVTGQASTTIRWVCKVETAEMTY